MKKSSNEKININRIAPNADYGLTDKQVEKYKKNGWSNEAVKPPVRTAKEIVAENIFTYYYCKYFYWDNSRIKGKKSC